MNDEAFRLRLLRGRFSFGKPGFAFALALALHCHFGFAAEPSRRQFNLPADAAETSLKLFSAQSGLEVLFGTQTVAGVRTNLVRGELSPLEAANRLLRGTHLVAAQNPNTGAIVVSRDDSTPAVPTVGTNREKPGEP